MSPHVLPHGPARPLVDLYQVRIWQLALLVAFAALAIVDVQSQRRSEPFLIGLAAAGYAAYGLLCWLVWHGLRKFESRLGRLLLVAVYAPTMGAVFLAAAILYLTIEYVFLGGSLL
jgi:hypothetical protein